MSGPSALAAMLTDGRAPSGGYAHSLGLEAAIDAGLGLDGAEAFVGSRLRTVGFCEAAFAAAAAHEPAAAHWLDLEPELAARTPSPPLRRAAGAVGRGLLATALAATDPPDPELTAYERDSGWTPRPIVFGALGGRWGLEPGDVARRHLYDDAMSLAAAATKLLAVDMRDAVAWVGRLDGEIDELARDIELEISQDRELPSVATPLLDKLSLDHSRSERRLFVS